MQKNSNRMAKVNEELKRTVSQIINYELKNSNVTGLVSVTKVKTTPDFKYAKVYLSIYNAQNKKKTLEAIKSSSGFIRSRVASELNFRTTPQLVFVYDDSEVQGERIDKILEQIKKEDAKFK